MRCFVALLLSFATRSPENQKLIASDQSFCGALSNVLVSSPALDVILEMFEITCATSRARAACFDTIEEWPA